MGDNINTVEHTNNHAYTNYGYDSPHKSSMRKISTTSNHSEDNQVKGSVRKVGVMNKPHLENNFLGHKISVITAGSNISSTSYYPDDERHKNKSYKNDEIIFFPDQYIVFTETERSWWYGFCLKFNGEDEGKKPWQPKIWRRVCPQPYCLSYRKVTRIIALTLIGLLAWSVLYALIGETAAPPKGRIFQLMVLSICSHFGGWLFGLTTLPALVGMLFTGIALQNLNIVNIDESFSTLNKNLSNVALVIILTRAGLDLDPTAVKRLKIPVLKLSLIPWLVEAGVTMVLSKYLLAIRWKYSLLLGSIIAAVAPAVVVPCLFRLRSKGYGVVKGIPTLIIAVASVDDALSVAIFGVVKGIIFNGASIYNGILFGSLSILAGIAIGIFWGIFCNLAPERNDPFAAPLRILLLLAGGMAGVFGSEHLGYGGAGPLICVTAAFVALAYWSKQGWDIEDNPAAIAFEIFWMIFQPILFGITGSRIKINEMDGQIVLLCFGILISVVILRICITILVGIGCNMNLKEKIFVAVAWISKGIVQAALGPVALSLIDGDTHPDERQDAQRIMRCCILSIIITAPTGALLTTLLGPILLTKEKIINQPVEMRIRKKSRRQSFLNPDLIVEKEKDENNKEPQHIPEIILEESDTPKPSLDKEIERP